MPRVSCIIPFYNVENYLSSCIESTLMQDYKNLHIVLINDGSSDNSLSIAKSFTNSKITLINLHKNYGASVARNCGMDFIMGGVELDKKFQIIKISPLHSSPNPNDFLIFIDSDDLLSAPNNLQILVSNAISNKSDIVLGISDVMEVNGKIRNGNKSEIFEKSNVMSGRDFLSKVTHNYFCKGPSNLMRTSFLFNHKIKFPESIINEDLEFGFECFLNAKRISSVDIPTYIRRQRIGSVSHPKTFNNHKLSLLSHTYIHNSLYLEGLLKNYPNENFTNLIKRCLAYNASPAITYSILNDPKNKKELKRLLPYANAKAKLGYYAPRVFKILHAFKQKIKKI